MNDEYVLPKTLIQKLDLVYITGQYGDAPKLKGILFKPCSFEDETHPLENLMVIGAVLSSNAHISYNPSPVFSEGKIEPQLKVTNNKTTQEWEGMHAYKIKDGYLIVEREWESILVMQEGRCFVPTSHGRTIDAIIFDEPLPFDRAKQLVYVRSPNQSVSFSHILHTRRFNEDVMSRETVTGEYFSGEYFLVYDNIRKLKRGRKWARNNDGDGIYWPHNAHLKSIQKNNHRESK